MATNLYFSQKVHSEQNLYEDIVIESLKMYGQDVYYLPRDIVNEDRIFGDDVPSRFNSSYKVEMYIENVDGFDGEGDLFTKFGVEIRDQATFVVARRRWTTTVNRFDNEINSERPKEGDLVYLPLSNSMFQIMAVEHEQPFYQLSNLSVYKLRAELFEYNDEDLDTGVDVIDDIERDYAYEYLLTLDSASTGFTIGETVNQTLASGVIMSGEVAGFSDSDNVLKLIHIGANDGKYHEFVSGLQVIGTTDINLAGAKSIANVSSVSEDNQISQNEQNLDFSNIIDDFLDFSEGNPFGDPENN
tara:strand:+ start:811 stop:1713 length:903 start_codon:yes stop_codon:yes gene_type:complete